MRSLRRVERAATHRLDWLRVCFLVVGVLYVVIVTVNPRHLVVLTDLERDLAGAEAIEHGVVPYQTLGDLADQVPGLQIPAQARDEWVAHTPVSLAGARMLRLVTGDHAAAVARSIGIIGVAIGAAYLLLCNRGASFPARAALVGAILLSSGVALDLYYVQGAALLASVLAFSLWLSHTGRRRAALIVLGLAVSWRPWCAPLAFFLPNSDRPLGDAVRVGSVAIVTTLAALPLVGGLYSLWSWLSDALPENGAYYIPFAWNISPIGAAWPVTGIVTLGGMFLLVVRVRPAISSDLRPVLGALAVLGLLPLVWPHYWVGLLPALLPPKRFPPVLLSAVTGAFLAMAEPIAPHSPLLDRVAGLLGVVLVSIGLLVASRSRPSPHASPFETPSATARVVLR